MSAQNIGWIIIITMIGLFFLSAIWCGGNNLIQRLKFLFKIVIGFGALFLFVYGLRLIGL